MIEKIEWDSSFFGYNVGCIRADIQDAEYIPELLRQRYTQDFQLIYIFITNVQDAGALLLTHIDNKLSVMGAVLIDKRAHEQLILEERTICLDARVAEYNGEMDEDEIMLIGLEAGAYSRYKKDQGFKNDEFTRMYSKWIKDSLSGITAEKVYLSRDSKRITGFLALSKAHDYVNINLIAVDREYRGKGFGQNLIDAAKYYAGVNGFQYVKAITQLDNEPAMQLYGRNKFITSGLDYIYHFRPMEAKEPV